MIKEFIPYELALELKQLGFNEPCLGSYYHAGKKLDIPAGFKYINHGEYTVLAPTYSQAFRWFREKHNLKSCIMFRTSMADNEEYYDWLIKGQEVVYRHFKTYEEAELACLKKLIEIVKGLESQ
jgi:hypothetical protein